MRLGSTNTADTEGKTMVDYSAALPQLQQYQAPNMLAMAAQANQMQLYQAQLAKAQNDAEMQSKLRSLNRNSPEFVNQLYAMDPAKGLAYEKGVLDFAEAKRKRGEAASDRATTAKKEAELAKIYGGFNNLTPAVSAAPANTLVAPAEPAVPQMGFGANVGGYTPTAASAAPAASPAVAAPSPNMPDYASVISNLVKGGHIDEAKKIADLAKTSAEGQGKATEASVAKFKAAYEPIQSLLPHVQTPADVEAYTRRLYADPMLGVEAAKLKPVDQAVQDNLDLVNKVGIDQWKARNSGMDAKQLHDLVTSATAPKIEKVDRGGSIVFVDTNPKSPTFNKELNEIQKTLSPKENVEKADTSKIAKHWVTDDKGTVTAFNERGEPIATHKGIGAPSSARQKAIMQAETMPKQLDYAISELENAIKKGGDLEAATGSGAGALADTAAGFVGYATPGAIASAQLKPVQDIILKMVPRFEGPQSDRDVISYRQASGELANEKLPVKVRQAAAETIIRLMKARKGQFITSEMASGEVPVQTSAGDALDSNNPLLK